MFDRVHVGKPIQVVNERPSSVSRNHHKIASCHTLSHFECPKLVKLAAPAQVTIYSLRDQSGLLTYCRDAKVRLVRADFLRELLAEGRTMPRRQEAEGMRTKDGRPALLKQEELEAKLPGGWVDKTHRFSVMALSHSWESREIPDLDRFQQGAPAQRHRFSLAICWLCPVCLVVGLSPVERRAPLLSLPLQRLRLRVLVEALDTFAEILQKIAPAHKLAKDWEAPLGTASQTRILFARLGCSSSIALRCPVAPQAVVEAHLRA